ncbi:unnamed protein product [Effrenium voratum]|nr:unnamed protein product [Effrenium voratum]
MAGDLRRLPSAPRLGLACGALRCTSADIRRWWAWWAAVKGELCAEDIVQHYILDSRYWERILRDSCVSQASCQMSFSQAEMALFFLVTLLVDGLETQDGLHFLIYLTRWSFILEALYFLVAVYVTLKARQATKRPDDSNTSQELCKLPMSVRAMSLLWTLAFPTSVLVCLCFWTLIDPIWNQTMPVDYVTVCEHFVNMLVFLVEFLVNRNIFYMKHGVVMYIYAGLYSLWSLLHYLLKVGVAPHMACHSYPLDECPIYPVLDWHKPGRTIMVTAGVVVMCVIIQLGIWKCTGVKDRRLATAPVEHRFLNTA